MDLRPRHRPVALCYQGKPLRGSREFIVGVVDLKKLLIVIVGLLGAILAGGANINV
jgi:hypothetical protein